jgi:pre-mRNA-splicing factor 18
MKAKGKEKKKDEPDPASNGMTLIDLSLVKTNPDKLYPLIYYALKRTLKEWEEYMDERPGMLFRDMLLDNCCLNSFCLDHVKRSTQGKLAAATQVQSAQYLKPFFKNLRSRVRIVSLLRHVVC